MASIPPIRGTHGDDVLTGSSANESFLLWQGGNDTVDAGDGNDVMRMGSAFNAGDKLDGGAGYDTVVLNGDYSDGVTLAADTMVNVELLKLIGSNDYNLTTDDATVAAGATLSVRAMMFKGHSLTFDGSAETDGSFNILGSVGGDTLIGGAQSDIFSGRTGADAITGNGGGDVFTYTAVIDSTGADGHDTIVGFDAASDRFNLVGAHPVLSVTGGVSGSVSAASFDTDLFNVTTGHVTENGALIVTVSDGDMIGHTLLVVAGNGDSAYEAGLDYVFDITGYTGTITTGDFI
jgi:Ca2+-binding RTX toxin-like protein